MLVRFVKQRRLYKTLCIKRNGENKKRTKCKIYFAFRALILSDEIVNGIKKMYS